MKIIPTLAACSLLALSLTACGSDEKTTTVYHDRPVVVQQPVAGTMTPSDVESSCAHGYDNSSHRCY